MLEKLGGKLPKNFPNTVLEGVKTRTLFVMSQGQKAEYLSSPENIQKMKTKRFVLGNGKSFKECPYIAISYFSRASAYEIIYGDYTKEEANLAYSICQSVLKVSHSESKLVIDKTFFLVEL
jgi:hypothetical protein